MTNEEIKKNLEERTLAFSVRFFDYLNTLPNKKIFWLVIDQLGRSGSSIGANYREANRAESKADHFRTLERSNVRTVSKRCLSCVNW